ncbi:tRNA (guanine(26)-N(2))-dimethyltransferase [Methanosarcina sp. KYL-1]|uniref:tRNA (guanine(10)-N(2))-dimethyltransferase n=1 Tax=Methanosarcina sp. KYL-1 TaxID=2602068 RepID=UPI00210096F5|nr:tRNA (guanine(10)-N(2))-dimethyltransferase [Methanosarcina sp. KYL-1]MCQ1535339.1 tRNA (guanine(26)-N(2))-dimethyltransferase [Methanosarcina sp. KYL-1]
MICKIITEGTTKVSVPVPPRDAAFPPSAAPVFYNPEMELNRDINVAATAVFVERLLGKKDLQREEVRYLDAFSASGIRGLRVAGEVGVRATLNDWSPEAVELIQENIKLNGLEGRAEATRKNANVLLHEQKFHIVDIDPFGTPSPFLDAASMSAYNLLSVTATDTAPLCGAHLNSGIRKYAAVPLNKEYHSEMGMRVLLGACARELAKHEKGMVPLLSHATRHYVRSYLEIRHGAQQTDRTLKSMGFFVHCPKCGFRAPVYGLAPHIARECPACGGITQVAGPLWLGPLRETGFCDEVLAELESRPLNTKEKAQKLVTFCRDELDIPMFYDQHVICKELGASATGIEILIEALRARGYEASRTHFSGTSFKTDAPLAEIKEIIRTL